MVRAWVAMGWALALVGCGNKQITQERVTMSDTDGDTATSTAADDPFEDDEGPDSNDEDTTSEPGTNTSSPTDPTEASNSASDTDTDTDTDPGTGTGFTDTGFTSDFTSTGAFEFWCADHDLGETAVPVSYSGSNLGRTDANLGSCTPGVNGDEFLLTWTAPEAGTYYIDTIGSDIDTVLYVLDSCSGTELACSDDISMEVLQSSLSLAVGTGETILIVVDGYNGDASGSFELYISA